MDMGKKRKVSDNKISGTMNDGEAVDWDHVYKQNYESTAFWEIHWLNSANALLASAREIEPKVLDRWENYQAHMQDNAIPLKADYYQGTYFMLVAYAIENLFKAAIVRKKALDYKQDFRMNPKFKFPKELKDHRLVVLAAEADFTFSLEEEDLLRRLTRHAIWAGRYPVPLQYNKTTVSEVFSNGRKYSVSWFGESDIKRLNAFVARIGEGLGFKQV
jgi:hypothetical protein